MDSSKFSLKKLKATPRDALDNIAGSVREFLVDSVSKTGGHIGANLGTVELTIALHYVFDSPRDMFVWDTGHTGYTHKLLTGRAQRFSTLNTYGGMNRFISRNESEHDFIEASHAGTSISIALGRALSLRNAGKPGWTVAVIGDGALVEGLALEALNHASVEKDVRMLIVLNDNGYAISPGFGAVHNYLQARNVGVAAPDTLFSSLGYKVIGPVDGHNVEALLCAYEDAMSSPGVCLVHVKTEKGRGLEVAAEHPFKMHFSFAFDKTTGALASAPASLSYQDIAARAIGECMEIDPSIVAITPSTLYATGLSKVFSRFPDRCFDPGMEEQHAMSMAVGMALSGSKPVLFYQSTFLQRAFDQLLHDVCFANQPMVILAVRSGFAGYDNPTHHGIYDLSYLRGLPNLEIFYPKDSQELYQITHHCIKSAKVPTLILLPYGPADTSDVFLSNDPARIVTPELLADGADGLIVSVGNKVKSSSEAMALLAESGMNFGLINIRKVKPLPEKELLRLIEGVSKVVTVEEGVLDGGFGSAVSALLHREKLTGELLQIGLPCAFIEAGSNAELSAKYRIDGEGIAKQIVERWGNSK